ncbi:putative peroxisomal dehydratase protein [Neofusicoccum parvum]|uniref:Peroxisomal dehydratase protein n=2 Tax=Neofusicoccum parvum TaxID=310453 RepID=A0ACB5RSE3_9PEZI|nr:putative peroxisomal dehydratase protein [Neofusicoccum parvum UCRNP2]GME23426.1 putative peroxisomal dehydratase protein [Neofusicoccum parvum]GME63540.1 putative peroxisomal dehydratase protein [Neofusicoccum parvum]
MSGPGVGFEYPPIEVAWLKRDLLLFANSIGVTVDELHFLYELHPGFAAFPTYPLILPFKHTDQEVVDFYARSSAIPIPGVPKFDQKRGVDGERKIEILKPLPTTSAGKTFEIRQKVLGVYDKGKPGTVIETETLLVEKASGDVYSRVIGSGFMVGQGNWGGPKGPKNVNYPPPEGKKPDATFVQKTSKETAHLYRLNGDYNPLHATPEPGQEMGFGGVIMHGLFSWNSTAHGVLKAFGASDPKNIKEFAARFASPVRPGDTLVTDMWRVGPAQGQPAGWDEIRFVTKVEGGKVVLSNGRAVVKVAEGAAKSKL